MKMYRSHLALFLLFITTCAISIDQDKTYFSENENWFDHAQEILESETKKAFEEYIATQQHENDTTHVSIKKDFALICDQENKTAIAIFETPDQSSSYDLTEEEAEKAKKIFNVHSIENQGAYKIIRFKYQDARLLPENRAQALFLLYAPYLERPQIYWPSPKPNPHKANPLNKEQINALYNQPVKQSTDAQQKFIDAFQRIAKDIPTDEGFSGATVVKTDQGYRKIEDIKAGDLVACYDKTTAKQTYNRVILTDKTHLSKHIQITFANNETIKVGPKHRFYAQSLDKFITAEELKNHPELQALIDIGIQDIQEVDQGLDVVRLGVHSNHNFYITDHDFLVHNFFPAPIIFIIPVATEATVKTALGVVTAGTLLYHFIGHHLKKHQHRSSIPQYSPNNFPQPPQDPDDQKRDEEHPNGKYKDADYHHRNSKGAKSPAPKDGQKALDNSVPVEGGPHRVGISEGEIVVLRQTAEGIFHGYVTTWKALAQGGTSTQAIRSALMKYQLVNNLGKIFSQLLNRGGVK